MGTDALDDNNPNQSHTKKSIKAKDLIVFPWEKEPKKDKKVWTRGEILDVINRRKERAKANGKS